MVDISRSFRATKYLEATQPENFEREEPIGRTSTIVHISKTENKLDVIAHDYPEEPDDWDSRTQRLKMDISDWADIIDFLNALKRFRE
ncbi:hypothetical protein ACOJIV_28625, partial [Haloarcula sp. AONF1]